ncbi:RNA polymerase, sigma 32 subunit, RpoH [gut metagenome]|uniref:RNA polymerase, sigma 32 subunit, RpoH n=1 Tax=gut metagenome TaxID=749906 RepID=J9G975_9ZZZZ
MSSHSLSEKPSNSTALVTYKAPSVPAIIGPLGDLEAFMRAAERAPMLTPEEERSLALRLRDKNDVDAAQRLVLSHLRLVISIARGFLGYGLPYADLIQEGNIGLMKAIRHYDPDRGARLMTFATHWIKSEIQEYIIRNWRIVKLATTKNQRKLFFNLRQMKEDSQYALTYQQAERIALTLDVKPKEVLDMEERMYGQESSFDSPINAGEDREEAFSPADWLSRKSDEPETILEAKEETLLETEGLSLALNTLDERSRRIIEARYLNIDENGKSKPITLQELATELGVSAERVRQIEKQALIKMRQTLTESHFPN